MIPIVIFVLQLVFSVSVSFRIPNTVIVHIMLTFQILPNLHMGATSMQRYGVSKRADTFADLENVWKDLGFQVGYE